MAQADVAGRRIAVIGDMLELGDKELDYHRDAGRAIPKSVDTVVGVGKRSCALLDGAREAGFESGKLHHFEDAQSAGGFLKTFIRPGDLVLIKASRGIGLDRIVNMLTNSGHVEGAH
jgi:UDP-N-acetylmuramoyl-tripeptide--D-alanyl-D-alanine ligase